MEVTDKSGNRLKIYTLDLEMFFLWMVKNCPNVPEGAEYKDCHYYPDHDCFGIKVEHESFLERAECSIVEKEALVFKPL